MIFRKQKYIITVVLCFLLWEAFFSFYGPFATKMLNLFRCMPKLEESLKGLSRTIKLSDRSINRHTVQNPEPEAQDFDWRDRVSHNHEPAPPRKDDLRHAAAPRRRRRFE